MGSGRRRLGSGRYGSRRRLLAISSAIRRRSRWRSDYRRTRLTWRRHDLDSGRDDRCCWRAGSAARLSYTRLHCGQCRSVNRLARIGRKRTLPHRKTYRRGWRLALRNKTRLHNLGWHRALCGGTPHAGRRWSHGCERSDGRSNDRCLRHARRSAGHGLRLHESGGGYSDDRARHPLVHIDGVSNSRVAVAVVIVVDDGCVVNDRIAHVHVGEVFTADGVCGAIHLTRAKREPAHGTDIAR